MELWPLFGGRTEFLKAPRSVVHRCRIIQREKNRANRDAADKQAAELAKKSGKP